jgi:hypothetical protein
VDVDAVVHELAAQRLGEALDRVLRPAVRRLERDAPVRERRADLNDRSAVARRHPPHRRHRPPHVAEVRHLGRAPKLLGRDIEEPREDRGHRVVHPHVDRPELVLDQGCRLLDRLVVRHIERERERLRSTAFHLSARAFEAVLAARDERDLRGPLPCELDRRRAADAGRGAGHDDDFAVSARSGHSITAEWRP